MEFFFNLYSLQIKGDSNKKNNVMEVTGGTNYDKHPCALHNSNIAVQTPAGSTQRKEQINRFHRYIQ
jgi:hypothetical protein